MEAADMTAVVHRYVEAFETSNIDIIRDMYAENATVEDPVGTDPYVGMEAILGFYKPALDAGAKLELTGNPRCAGNAVAFPFRVHMTGFNVEVIDVFEFDNDGKVVSMKAYWSG